jgi:hypothetical protein
MEMDVQSLKEEVNAKSEELDIRLRCLHEFQMSTNQKHFAHAGENKAELRLVWLLICRIALGLNFVCNSYTCSPIKNIELH